MMVYWSWFLHFYQPPTQFPEVTEKIAKESYEKILKILQRQKCPASRLAINFSASLTEQLVKLGLSRVINGYQELAREGRVELISSAAYHPLLPKIPQKEMERQISLSGEINRKYFGPAFAKATAGKGFFPPEMAYSSKVGQVVEKLGYQWIILDENALGQKLPLKTQHFIYHQKSSKMAVFIRNRQLSIAIAFGRVSNLHQLFQFFDAKGYNLEDDCYIITAMDAETFGHHQPKQLKFLEEILQAPNLKNKVPISLVTISELINLFPWKGEIEAKTSTWGDGWERWDDPKNPIHRLQWRLYNLALEAGADTEVARQLLDRALHSDQFWWASFHTHYWQPQMIEKGARMLRDVIMLSAVSPEKKKESEKLYNEIMAKVGPE